MEAALVTSMIVRPAGSAAGGALGPLAGAGSWEAGAKALGLCELQKTGTALRKRCSTVELGWLPETADYIGARAAQSTAFVLPSGGG